VLDDATVWVVGLGRADDLPAALAVRLAACIVHVPPLARRTLELPALSAGILHTLAQRAGRPTPALSPRARTHLATRDWPGDVLELEAVLAGAMAATEAPTLDLTDVGGAGNAEASIPEEPVPQPPPTTNPGAAVAPLPPSDATAVAASDPRLERLLAELAHEILNPLVTVKTFADHLPQLLDDAPLREQFASRTNEAVTRIQQLLDNVAEFSRFDAPRTTSVKVAAMLDQVLAEAAPELESRSLAVRRVGEPDVTCAGDAEQLEYALRNLMAGVVRETPPRDGFTVETTQNGTVRLQFSAGKTAAARLRRLVSSDDAESLADPQVLPLAFSLARAVIERNGGRLDVEGGDGGTTTLVVRLPTASDEGDG
jgi:signal transduction histidine kinase